MGTVPRVLVRKTVSPDHADFGRLSSGACRLWQTELGSLPRRRLTRRRASPAPLFCANGGGLSVG
jgi:hypothetical protein